MTGHDVVDLARKFEDYGVEGDHLHRHRARRHADAASTSRPRSSSRATSRCRSSRRGGLSSIADIKALAQHEADGIIGAIAGRAIYDGTLNFKDALKAAAGG